MAVVDPTGRLTAQVCRPESEGRQPTGANLHSSDESGELLQRFIS